MDDILVWNLGTECDWTYIFHKPEVTRQCGDEGVEFFLLLQYRSEQMENYEIEGIICARTGTQHVSAAASWPILDIKATSKYIGGERLKD